MNTGTDELRHPATVSTLQPILTERGADVFVWGIWAAMLLVALAYISIYGRNIPLSEDWLLVPPLTGHEPDIAAWLWAQHIEHRVPLPKLILLLLLKLTGGDFRAGMVFNTLALGALALAMNLVARHLRGGRTSYADAFFPIALLHLGNWESLAWSWMFQFVASTVLACTLLLVIVEQQALLRPRAAVIAGICLVLLPLCGANGLALVPTLALWLSYNGVLHWRLAELIGARRWTGLFLLGSAATALLLTGVYFIGYVRPEGAQPSPSIWVTLNASAKFLALSFGPVAAASWPLSTLAAVGVLLSSGAMLMAEVLRTRGVEQLRALGLLSFLGSIVMLALGVGWGRAGSVEIDLGLGMPTRYVILAVPALCAGYFTWELYGPPPLRNTAQMALFVVMFVLIPMNTQAGFQLRDWYLQGMDAVERDLTAQIPRSVLAERHRASLLHWDQAKLASGMQLLHQAGIGPFRRMREDSAVREAHYPVGAPLVEQEFRYRMPEAGEVVLVWGVNGWAAVPEAQRPAGTVVKEAVMHTPMERVHDAFVAKVQVPSGATIHYGFLITKRRSGAAVKVWEGKEQFHKVAVQGDVVEVKSTLTLEERGELLNVIEVGTPLIEQEIRYQIPEAGEVFLVWGVNRWAVMPEAQRPAGTVIKDGVMHTPMERVHDVFVAKVQVPSGATIHYAFLITKRRSGAAVKVWEGKEQFRKVAVQGDVVEVKSTLTLGERGELLTLLLMGLSIGVLLISSFAHRSTGGG